MSADRYLEMAPLSALDVLDGEDRAGFDAHVLRCAACRAEVAAYSAIAARLALALAPAPPRPGLLNEILRRAQLAPVAPAAPAARLRPLRPGILALLATAAAIVLAVSLVLALQQGNAARLAAKTERQRAERLEVQLVQLREELSDARAILAHERGLRELVAQPAARLATLAALPPAPGAAARVVWHPETREAWLLASGLAPAPAGKGYEVWVIGKAAPVPAGVFQVDAEGKAVFRMPSVDETAKVKTFAVTVEPAEGTPAPTGPMVLAGTVS
jgi:anti-sigma-K factor RskA